METVNVSVTTWPVVQSMDEAEAHDHNQPALVAVPGHLVRPISVMIEKLFSLDSAGTLARGIEMQLVGLAEARFVLRGSRAEGCERCYP